MLKVLIGFWLLMTMQGVGAEQPLESFGYALPLEVAQGSGLARIALPAVVYEGAASATLADLRVFDAEGRPVHHALEPARAPAAIARFEPLQMFPVMASADVALDESRVRVETRGQKVTVSLEGTRAPGRSMPRTLRGYLIDLGNQRPSISGLRLEWQSDASAQLLVVQVERSDSLDQWDPVSGPVTLARLQSGGQTLLRDTVEFSAARARYLRLTFPGAERIPDLTAVRGQFSDPSPEVQRHGKEIEGKASERSGGNDGDAAEFDLGGAFPVDRLQLVLPGDNAVVPVEILSRRKPSDAWGSVAQATFYRIAQGAQRVSNPEVSVPVSRHRYWKLRALTAGTKLPSTVLKVEWVPEQLVFVMQGQTPYQLAYGHAQAADTALPIGTLVPGWGTDRAPVVAEARAGAQRVMAGAEARKAPVDVRRWALWGSLAAGVLLLGWMALSLVRQMRAGQVPKQ